MARTFTVYLLSALVSMALLEVNLVIWERHNAASILALCPFFASWAIWWAIRRIYTKRVDVDYLAARRTPATTTTGTAAAAGDALETGVTIQVFTSMELLREFYCIALVLATGLDAPRIFLHADFAHGFSFCPMTLAVALFLSVVTEVSTE